MLITESDQSWSKFAVSAPIPIRDFSGSQAPLPSDQQVAASSGYRRCGRTEVWALALHGLGHETSMHSTSSLKRCSLPLGLCVHTVDYCAPATTQFACGHLRLKYSMYVHACMQVFIHTSLFAVMLEDSHVPK